MFHIYDIHLASHPVVHNVPSDKATLYPWPNKRKWPLTASVIRVKHFSTVVLIRVNAFISLKGQDIASGVHTTKKCLNIPIEQESTFLLTINYFGEK